MCPFLDAPDAVVHRHLIDAIEQEAYLAARNGFAILLSQPGKLPLTSQEIGGIALVGVFEQVYADGNFTV